MGEMKQHELRNGIEGKACTKCNTWQPLTNYHKDKGAQDLLGYWCKQCVVENVRRHARENHEIVLETARRSREKNHDSILDRQRAYREQNREVLALKQREYCQRHPEYNRKFFKENPGYGREYRERNQEKIREYVKRYNEEHREERQERRRAWRKNRAFVARANVQRYRARKRKAYGVDFTTHEMVSARIELYGGLCYICGRDADAVDHVKPIMKGGAHLPCNLRPICKQCNGRKSDQWPFDITKARMEAQR